MARPIASAWAWALLFALCACGAAPDETDVDDGEDVESESEGLQACGKFDAKPTLGNGGCKGSKYNCKIRKYRDDPKTKKKEGDGAFRLKNRKTGKMLFPIQLGTLVREGAHGLVVGAITANSHAGEPGCPQGPCVKLNLGQKKDIDGVPHHYAWVSETDQGARSGWVRADSLLHEPKCFVEQNLHTPADDTEVAYVIHPSNDAAWTDESGHPYMLELENCNKPGARATDYLNRKGNLVNLSWTLPGFALGTGSVDTVSNNTGVRFYRYSGVKALETRFYNCATHAPKDMKFYYGRIGGVRGWMAAPNITKL